MARTSITGYQRQYGGNGKKATPAVFPGVIQFTLDPTAANADTGKVLPIGAIPISVQNVNGGATGGTSPTIDVGTQADPDGFANELDADGQAVTVVGDLLGVPLTENTAIYAGVGGSAATGGSVIVLLSYIMQDDGTP